MRVIVDTNVVLSGFFFGGVPGRVLEAWRDGHFELILSAAILAEYREAGAAFGADLVDPTSRLSLRSSLFMRISSMLRTNCLSKSATTADDDKFLAFALAPGVRVIVSGDKKLRALTGWSDIDIVTPRQFLDTYLPNSA